jgi:Concanavalin A-like lectin/glucanases superfamily/PEP-CTERM motif
MRTTVIIVASVMVVGGGNVRADYTSVVAGDSPAVWFRFDEGPGATTFSSVDSSITGHHYNGAVAGIPGLSNCAAAYDGIDDRSEAYSSLFTPGIFTANTGFSVELWMKVLPQNSSVSLFQWYDGPRNGGKAFYEMVLESEGGVDARVRDNDGNYQWVGPSTPVTDDRWHHLVMAFGHDATNLPFRYLYMDGVLAGSDTTVPLSGLAQSGSAPVPLDIGTHLKWETPLPNYYDGHVQGSLDDIAVYRYALTPQQIAAHYAAGVPEPATLSLLALGGLAVLRGKRK